MYPVCVIRSITHTLFVLFGQSRIPCLCYPGSHMYPACVIRPTICTLFVLSGQLRVPCLCHSAKHMYPVCVNRAITCTLFVLSGQSRVPCLWHSANHTYPVCVIQLTKCTLCKPCAAPWPLFDMKYEDPWRRVCSQLSVPWMASLRPLSELRLLNGRKGPMFLCGRDNATLNLF